MIWAMTKPNGLELLLPSALPLYNLFSGSLCHLGPRFLLFSCTSSEVFGRSASTHGRIRESGVQREYPTIKLVVAVWNSKALGALEYLTRVKLVHTIHNSHLHLVHCYVLWHWVQQ